ncbi:hypothetical protein CCYS_03680 [Corynebacterium cystitidis DSM 20524]|uniref:Uncharacterized protein n=1 Tax=Corynebacterium cystitidis DSM 20524 TaxID=1121357 RepID=A0A1H9QS32_9CORY|nr:hypothetical protein CCYS_03680 [Corynebacterium cystitidis DSM 20524]SER62533.1 hypothetical protein SAMN05661109_00629 [Corynebacterium cystitidis DSM 20524]SNV84722.1 Uncharacterised protein [Corynebacterium cystitidis]
MIYPAGFITATSTYDKQADQEVRAYFDILAEAVPSKVAVLREEETKCQDWCIGCDQTHRLMHVLRITADIIPRLR